MENRQIHVPASTFVDGLILGDHLERSAGPRQAHDEDDPRPPKHTQGSDCDDEDVCGTRNAGTCGFDEDDDDDDACGTRNAGTCGDGGADDDDDD